MGTILEASPNAVWRQRLIPARYGNAQFHVEQQSRQSGRRVVLHEYPKKDLPFAEDMGRHAIRYNITGYIIGPNYHIGKAALINELEKDEGADLYDFYVAPNTPLPCVCERYSVTETRERGGFCTFEMTFVELGVAGNSNAQQNSKAALQTSALNAGNTRAQGLDASAAQAVDFTNGPFQANTELPFVQNNASVTIGEFQVTGGG